MPQNRLPRMPATLASAAALLLMGGPAHALADAQAARPVAPCSMLAERTSHDYSILSATPLEATDQVPEQCRVLGMLPPEIMFEVVLPTRWNGRILMRGNGGYAGASPVSPGPMRRSNATVADGFVSVYTNTGHDREAEPLATFALNNRQKEIDYSFRAVRLTIQTAKELVGLYYGQPPTYTYWQGCSTGGRQGLMEAQRFPKDFDGILVGAPVLDFTGTQISGAWNAKALAEAPISLAKIGLVAEAVYDKCDGLDGLVDGLLDDPRSCDFDPAKDLPRCGEGSGDSCFSAAEVGALEKVYGGVISGGERIFPGLPFGIEAPISLAKIGLVAEAVYDKCDGLDGLVDGLLDDPRSCDFDPAKDLPRCGEGSGDSCFSAAEVGALEKVYGGVISGGERIFPGLPFGIEAEPPSGRRRSSGWNRWLINEAGPSTQQVFAETFLQYMAFEPDEPEFDWRSFDFDGDPGRTAFIRSILDATDPDLTRFRDSGGKMLMYFGWADPALNPLMGVDYYERAELVTGGGTRDFFRLFMVPGMFHCSGGLGVFQADYFGALMEWVEDGTAPDRIEAARVVEGQTEMTRPLCPYPEVAVHDGTGDPKRSESFACASPPAH